MAQHEKTRRRVRTAALYACAFIIPICVQLIAYLLLNMYPFGENTLLTWDLRMTYSYYFEWFRNVLLGDGNVMYSFSKSLGGNMFAGFATICASPLNLLLLLFRSDNPVNFVTALITVKFGFAGSAALFYLRNRFKLADAHAVALAICYACMLFMTTQAMNPMWMDVVIVLPFVMMGIYRLVREGRMVMFYVSLLASILISWYNGYQLCIFAVLYYLFECIIYSPEAREEGKRVRCRFMVMPGRFSVSYTLAILSSFVVLIPTAYGLLQGKGAVSSDLVAPGLRVNYSDLIRSFMLGEYIREWTPQIYAGMLVLLCCVVFFMNTRIPKRERAAVLRLLVLLAASMLFAPLDRIWCGMRDGISFYCRFSYLFSAVMLFAAARAIEAWNEHSRKHAIIACAGIVVYTIFLILFKFYLYIAYPVIAIALVILLACTLILAARVKHPALKTVACIMLILLVTFDATASTYQAIAFRMPDKAVSGVTHYKDYFNEGRSQITELDKHDGTDVNAYRIQKMGTFLSKFPKKLGNDVNVSSNEGFVYGYSQISQYDSTYDDSVQNLMCNLGYSPESLCWTTYNYPLIAADSLLGIKYVAAEERPLGYVKAGLKKTQDDRKFFENPSALPLGFGASYDVVERAIEVGPFGTPGLNPFKFQNDFYSTLVGSERTLYQPLEFKEGESSEESRSWEVKVPARSYSYGYFAGPNYHVTVYVDDEDMGLNMADWKYGAFPLFNNTDNDKIVTVTLKPAKKYAHAEGFNMAETELTPYFHMLDQDSFNATRDELASRPFSITAFEDGYVSGVYDATGDELLFTTIPYDAGWNITVNGSPVEALKAQSTFIAIPVAKGNNEISMRYVSPGLAFGAIVSAISCMLFLAYAIVCHRKDSSGSNGSRSGFRFASKGSSSSTTLLARHAQPASPPPTTELIESSNRKTEGGWK